MTDLSYTITIEVDKPIGHLGIFGPVSAAKISSHGKLYGGKDPAEQLERACIGLVSDIRTKLRIASGRPA